jgi:DNA polymerase III subunit gamma/tau
VETRITRHEPLYLKYRPQSLAELVGQEAVTRTLSNAITYNRLTHAYLFTGPRGTGKTSSARILAKSLNCEASSSATIAPCQECGPCKEITSGISPAVMEIDAASNNSVDDARLLIERAPLKAVGGRNKIYIIDECHMLTKEAFNALLKTIEQPPPDVVFILATTEEHKVLPTIISRCQRLMFRNVEQGVLSVHLRNVATKENIEIEDEALKVIARRSGGGLRDALSTLDQASLLGAPGKPVSVNDLLRLTGALHEDVLLDISERILTRDGNRLLQSMSALLSEGREPSVLAKELSAHFLNLAKATYLAKTPGCTTENLRTVILGSDQYLDGILIQAPKYEGSELSQIIEALDRLEGTCRRTSQPTMHLEMGLLSICHRHDMLLIRELSERVAKLEQIIQDGGELRRPEHTQTRPPAGRPAPTSAPSPAPSAVRQADSYPSNVPDLRTLPAASDRQIDRPPQPAESAPSPQSAATFAGESSRPEREQQNSTAPGVSVDNSEPDRVGSDNISSRTEPEPEERRAESSAPAAAAGIDDVEYVWSRILDELHRINIPTHGFFNSRVAFLIDMNADEMVFGVKSANFQKTLEQKANHLKSACKAIIGKELNVRVKIAADAKPIVAANANTRRPSQPSYSEPVQSSPRESAGRPEPGNDAPASVTTRQTTESGTGDGTVAEFDNGAVKEAYKLFEGPGSRRIQ